MIKISNINDMQSLIKTVSEYSDAPWKDAWSSGQLQSKMWLLDELLKIKNSFDCIYLIGGWIGTLPWLFFHDSRFYVNTIKSFDIDPSCEEIADKVNINKKIDEWKFKAVTKDAMEMNFSEDGIYQFVALKSNNNYSKPKPEKPDCIINTSCDHFENLKGWIDLLPENVLIVLQNTNVSHDETHINCVKNIDEFINQSTLKNVFFSGEIDCGSYKRFMIIGQK